jgi:hypothetical protein
MFEMPGRWSPANLDFAMVKRKSLPIRSSENLLSIVADICATYEDMDLVDLNKPWARFLIGRLSTAPSCFHASRGQRDLGIVLAKLAWWSC